MNAIGGYVPSAGRIELDGESIAEMSAQLTAPAMASGGRSRRATLFPELTVRETVQLALEARDRTGRCDRRCSRCRRTPPRAHPSREADELIDFLGLGRYAEAYIADLSTGTRRIVELAGLLALDARLLCLDEPTAGLAHARPKPPDR